MKKRKILVLIPALGLLLSGCTFQEGFATAKHWVGQHMYHPVKDWIDSITGKKKDEQKPSGEEGGGDEGGGGEHTEEKFTVTFNVQGHGSAPASVEVDKGGKVTKPTDPSAEGWTFGGWFKEAACTNAWDFANDTVTADVTLYAKWTENGGGDTTNYGTEDSPLSVSDALAVIEKECTTDGSLTKQRIFCVGLVSVVDKTLSYDSGPCFELHVADKADSTKVVHVYRVHCTEEQKANVVVGAEIKFSGFAKNFKDELEFVDNGQEACSILTVTAPSGEDAVTGVAFNATSYEVAVGGTAKVAATVQPLTAGNKNVTYSLKEVSPAGCVTISGDTLTGVAVGSAKVVVTTEEGGFTAEVPVSVVAATNYGTLDNPISVTAAKAIIDKECGTDKKSNTDEVIYCEAEIKTLGSYNDKGYYNAVTVKDESNEIYIHTLNVSAELKDSVVEGATIKFHGYGKYYNSAPQFGTANNVYVTIDSVITETPTVSAVTLDQPALALEVGAADVQLHATVEGEHNPSQAVTWHSSNKEAATVDENGFVHAVAEGEAEITATSVLDTKVVSEPCVVTVTEPETPIVLESISVTGPTKTSYTAGQKLDLSGLVVTAHYEGGASEVVEKWTSDPEDGATLTTDNEKVTITYEGKTAEVVITVEGVDPFVAAYEAGEALAHNKTTEDTYTFSGVVVGKRATDYYVQNGSYGIDLYNPGSVEGLAVGKEVTVTAKMKKYSGVIETAASPTVVVGDEVETLPTSLTIDSPATLEAAKQNIRVNVAGEVTNKTTNSGGDVTLTLSVGGGSVNVFIKSSVKTLGSLPALADATVGQSVTLTDAARSIYSTSTVTNHQVIACENSGVVVTSPNPTGVNITTTATQVAVEGSLTLEAEVLPAAASQSLEWTIVEGGEHATLVGNVLTGVSAGDVVVRATAVGFSSVYAEKTIEVASTVIPTEQSIYTLSGSTATGGNSQPHNAYAEAGEGTQNGITWSVMGNSYQTPWRLGGGKNTGLTNVDRAIESTSALTSDDVSKVIVTTGTATINVNSVKLLVGTEQGKSDVGEVVISTGTLVSATLTFERPSGQSWANRYFSIVFNVSTTTAAPSSHQYVQFVSAEFFAVK